MEEEIHENMIEIRNLIREANEKKQKISIMDIHEQLDEVGKVYDLLDTVIWFDEMLASEMLELRVVER